MSICVFGDSKLLMRAFEQTVGEINPPQARMYATLVQEEVGELRSALAGIAIDRSPARLSAVCDGIIDSIVVLAGLGHSLGLPLQAAWDEVLRSNMSKLHEGKLVRREDGKVLKGPAYSAPNLQALIEGSLGGE